MKPNKYFKNKNNTKLYAYPYGHYNEYLFVVFIGETLTSQKI